MSVRILVGHVLDKLAELPDESVHCCVTSPPYYGLRDYGIEPQVWGGDPSCLHEWGDEVIAGEGYSSGNRTRWQHVGGREEMPEDGFQKQTKQGAFCRHCDAWRGSLGLEPTPALYVEHMVAVFREVRRVLRRDGTLWLNLGGVYAGSWGAQGRNGEASGLSANQINNHPQFGSRTGSRGVSGGKHPSQSRQPSHALACDTDGKARSNSLDLGSACSGRDGADQDDFRSRRDRTLRNAQSSLHASPRGVPKDRDSGHLGCAADLASIALLAARLSTNLSLPESVRDAFARASEAADHSFSLTSPDGEPLFAHMDEYSPGSVWSGLASRNRDMDVSGSACGCGHCGICFIYLATKALRFKPKDLMPIPDLLALALQADGWWLRSEITWAKRAPMPESVTDRPTSATEKVFLLTKSARYYYDAEAVKEDAEPASESRYKYDFTGTDGADVINDRRTVPKGQREFSSRRNMRNWWLLGPEPFPEAHFATFVSEIPRRAILAGTSERGVCPKCGAPWARVITQETRPNTDLGVHPESGGRPHRNPGGGVGSDRRNIEAIGWRASCSCNAGVPVPATVLDPFLGAGTTALVADRLGRNCIGIELNPEYAEMAERRVRSDAPLFAEIESTRHIAQGGK